MYTVTRELHFCYGHRLLKYQGKCRYLHGHNAKLEIEVSAAALDRLGMVRDFGEIKRKVQDWIDEHLDHKMILSTRDPVLPILKQLREPVFVMRDNPTAEAIAKLIYDVVKRMGFPVTCVRLWETPQSVATYQARPSKA